MGKKIACVGDLSESCGVIIDSGQDGKFTINYSGRSFGSGSFGEGSFGGAIPAVEGAMHSCPIKGHGITPITAITTKTYYNNKLILTEDAVAGCGCKMIPANRNILVE